MNRTWLIYNSSFEWGFFTFAGNRRTFGVDLGEVLQPPIVVLPIVCLLGDFGRRFDYLVFVCVVVDTAP